ncbi:MAG: hypothetical protein CVV27_04985 [Candidatus Melainabacteria bacterium HGW-Melainabacteria-1]|nr:MAG: hypothetical protein CVV27_04985 [Candidatus Melainabacteria bacterium HGW-Melainabacteria-1]
MKMPLRPLLILALLTQTTACDSDFDNGLIVGIGIGVAATVTIVAVSEMDAYPGTQTRNDFVSSSDHLNGRLVGPVAEQRPVFIVGPVSRSTPIPRSSSTPRPSATPTPSPEPTPEPVSVPVFDAPVFEPVPVPTATASPTSAPVCADSSCEVIIIKPPTTKDALQPGLEGF